MNKSFRMEMPQANLKSGPLWQSLSFLIVFFLALVVIDAIWTFLVREVTFYFSVFLFSSVLTSLVRFVVSLPSMVIILIGTFFRISRFSLIIVSFFATWVTAYSIDFFWANMIQSRFWGFDLVLNGEMTHYGVVFGLILSSRDVFLVICAAYLVLWRRKK